MNMENRRIRRLFLEAMHLRNPTTIAKPSITTHFNWLALQDGEDYVVLDSI